MRRLGELSDLVGGQATQPDVEIAGAASISRAGPSDITFVNSAKYLQQFLESNAGAAVVTLDVEACDKPVIRVESAEDAFTKIAEVFKPPIARQNTGIDSKAVVSPSAKIADNVSIHAGAVVMDNAEIGFGTVIFPNAVVMENCVIGSNVKIYPNATLYENTVVGDRAIVHAGAVLGAFGFGYKSNSGEHLLSAQLGNVVIGNDVEIGANSTIDRGTYDSTVIGNGTKLDDLVMVGHNCVIGEHNLFCSQVGIAGSCTTGDYVVMGGQVGLADHINIGSKASIAAKSGLMNDVEEGARMFGVPARAAREELQIIATRAKLPEMRKTVSKLVQRVEKLEKQADSPDCRAA
jgi:UDP-3-O-[3-hydroxymyristoyl] glucosamine N-acyltransferase